MKSKKKPAAGEPQKKDAEPPPAAALTEENLARLDEGGNPSQSQWKRFEYARSKDPEAQEPDQRD